MIDCVLVFMQYLCNIARRSEIGNIVHEKIHNTVHQSLISDIVFLPDIPQNQRVKHLADVGIFVLLIFVQIRARHTTLPHIAFQRCIRIVQSMIRHKLLKRKWIHLDFKGPAGEQRSQIGAQQKSIGACNIDIIPL